MAREVRLSASSGSCLHVSDSLPLGSRWHHGELPSHTLTPLPPGRVQRGVMVPASRCF